VAAVVAMQGNVTMDSAAAFVKRFFEELLKDGWVERAAAAARSAIEAHEDWWAPVVYLRLSGPLWPEDRTIDYANLPAPGEAPYKGLQYFDVSDAGLFFGRQALTARLIAHLKEKNFLAVVGASGSGKSSLVRAGLMPALRSGEPLADGTRPPQDSARWLVHIVTPTAHPLESLAASLTREAESVTATATLIDDLRRDARSLHLYALRRLAQSGSPRLLVVVDQFEEVFTACKDPGERQVFVDNLIFAGRTNADGPTVVVITLRADFYPHCAQYDGLRAALEECQIYIGAMNRNELRAAIEEPAKLGNWTLEAGLVDLILDDVGDEPGGLPLLSHALLETWKRRQRRSLTLAGYTAAGGVHKAIAHTADALYGSLNADEQRIAQGIFLRLTELGEGAQDTRRRARLDELAGRAEQSEQVERVLKRLADARLITTSQEEAEVAHEALIREWPTLRQWLEDNRAELRLHRRLTEAAQEWNSRGRDPAELYRGNRLAQVGNWSKEHAAGFSSLEKEFLAASQAAQASERRKRRVQWASIASVLTLLGLVIVASVAGWLDPLVYRPVDMQDYWVTIPAGVFLMGSEEGDPEAYEDEVPQHPVQLAAYQIGRYEITNRQYWQCVRAGICVSPKNDRYILGVYQDHPVTDVSWNDAVNFCRWIGGRLPSEAEWEKAARGTDGRRYPWGNHPPDCSLANITDDNGNACIGDTAPVDSNPDGVSPYGVYNLAGNVWEWTQSLYLDYPYEALDGRESFEALGDRVLRGGAWYGSRRSVRSADRYGVAPDYWNLILGFRCARSL
jgi:formylglycine-generating enzyme required for sulfatase activity/energy-coupling factor transporter ATP-binding protein EcfA2